MIWVKKLALRVVCDNFSNLNKDKVYENVAPSVVFKIFSNMQKMQFKLLIF